MGGDDDGRHAGVAAGLVAIEVVDDRPPEQLLQCRARFSVLRPSIEERPRRSEITVFDRDLHPHGGDVTADVRRSVGYCFGTVEIPVGQQEAGLDGAEPRRHGWRRRCFGGRPVIGDEAQSPPGITAGQRQ
jgi:hypothetical protein